MQTSYRSFLSVPGPVLVKFALPRRSLSMELVAGVLIRPGLLLELVTGLCFHVAVLHVEAVREVGCCG